MPDYDEITQKVWIGTAVVAAILVILAVIFGIRLLGAEDAWVCSGGQWVRHGNPSAPMPETGCGIAETVAYQGVVSQISDDQLKIKTGPTEEVEFKAADDIELLDMAGKPVSLSDLKKGFSVLVKGMLGADNVITATSVKIISEPNIIVDSPQPGDIIGNPVDLKGQARVFENTFNYRIKDGAGKVLVEKAAMANAPDAGFYGDFTVSIRYSIPQTDNGTVEVFDYSAKDGSVMDLVSVPVVFKKLDAAKIKLYFGSSEKDPNASDCNKVFEVEREIPKTASIAWAALEELFLGPTPEEINAGYFSSLNTGVIIQKLAIENGVAKVDFNDMLQAGVGGSCKVAAIRAQITETLKQFPTVKSVVISIDGKTEDILQP